MTACTTLPTAVGWREMGGLLLLMAVLVFPFGWFTGFLYRQPVSPQGKNLALVVLVSFVFPALGEELLFRVLPVPLPGEAGAGSTAGWATASLVVFVLYHPVRAWLRPKPQYRVFLDTRFLLLAGLLGLFCTLAYLRSGSVWPPVLLHWFFVVVWMLFLGGSDRLHGPSKEVDL